MNIDFLIKDTVIETPRLVLRAWRESDLEDFYEYAKVEGVGECAGWPHHQSIDVSRRILDDFIRTNNVFAIEHKEDKKVIGSLGIHNTKEDYNEFSMLKIKEIGYALSRDYWGYGIMTEAVKAVIDYIFKNTDIQMLVCGHFFENDRSRHVIEKCGFQFRCERRYNAKLLKKTFDMKEYYILKEKYINA